MRLIQKKPVSLKLLLRVNLLILRKAPGWTTRYQGST